jgi:Spy/CpxP family protein refolding chaperone
MKKILVIIILVLCGLSTAAWAAEKNMKHMPEGMRAKKEFLASLNLTDAQKKDLAALKLENEKRGIALRAKAETAKLELHELLMADAPDHTAIEKMMAELIKTETDIRMNKIDGWFAANKMLTADQQKIWIKALRVGTMQAMGGKNKGMHRPMGEREPSRPDMK